MINIRLAVYTEVKEGLETQIDKRIAALSKAPKAKKAKTKS
jgi:hypothetical protein